MKKLVIVSAIVMSGFIYKAADAQIGVHFNINLGARPVIVAPAPVYSNADFYYLPDVEAYYSVNQHSYYYQDGGSWITAAFLPGRFHDYDWAHARRFAVNEPRPYLHNDVYRARYGGLQGRRDWNYRDDHNTRVYADRDRVDHDQNRGRNNSQPQHDDRGHSDGKNDHQQNNDHNTRGNNNDRGGRDNGHDRSGRF